MNIRGTRYVGNYHEEHAHATEVRNRKLRYGFIDNDLYRIHL